MDQKVGPRDFEPEDFCNKTCKKVRSNFLSLDPNVTVMVADCRQEE